MIPVIRNYTSKNVSTAHVQRICQDFCELQDSRSLVFRVANDFVLTESVKCCVKDRRRFQLLLQVR